FMWVEARPCPRSAQSRPSIPGTCGGRGYSVRAMSCRWFAPIAVSALLASACASAPALAPTASAPPTHIDVHPVIVTPLDADTEPQLAARGERALMEQRWEDAVAAYRMLV